jgi:hypothetical protein
VRDHVGQDLDVRRRAVAGRGGFGRKPAGATGAANRWHDAFQVGVRATRKGDEPYRVTVKVTIWATRKGDEISSSYR